MTVCQRLLKGVEHKEDDRKVHGEKKESKTTTAKVRAASLEEEFNQTMKETVLMRCGHCEWIFVRPSRFEDHVKK